MAIVAQTWTNRARLTNYTAIPNALLEDLPNRTPAAARVALALARETFGWHRSSCVLSYSRLAEVTGLSISGVRIGVAELEQSSWISRQSAGRKGSRYLLRRASSRHSANMVVAPPRQPSASLPDSQVTPSKEREIQNPPLNGYSANVGEEREGQSFGDLEKSKSGVDSLGKAAPGLESSKTIKQVNGLKVQLPAAAAPREPDPGEAPLKEDPTRPDESGGGSDPGEAPLDQQPLFDPNPDLRLLFPHIAEDEGIDWEDLDRRTAENLFRRDAPEAHAAWRTIVKIRGWGDDTCLVQLVILLDHLAEDHRDGLGNLPVTYAMQKTLKAGPQDMGLPQAFYCNQRKTYRKQLLAKQSSGSRRSVPQSEDPQDTSGSVSDEKWDTTLENLPPGLRKKIAGGKAKLARRRTDPPDALGPAGAGGTPTTDPDPAVKDTK